MDMTDHHRSDTRGRTIRNRLITMGVVSVGAIVILAMLGASPTLVLEVFAMAAILAVGAVATVLLFAGRHRT